MEDKRDETTEEEETPIEERFPTMPLLPKLPEVPKFETNLPDLSKPRKGTVEPGACNKMALATTAVTSFIMPVLVLGAGGRWLDQKLKHHTAWLAFLGVVIGFIAGVASLLKIIKKLQD